MSSYNMFLGKEDLSKN